MRHYPAIITIKLPLPRYELSPNACRGQSRAAAMRKARTIRRYRKLAYEECLVHQLGCSAAEYAGRARIHYRFFWETRRRRDAANMIAMMKPAVDGLVDAGLLVDDDIEHLEAPTFEPDYDAAWPRVEITVSRGGTAG